MEDEVKADPPGRLFMGFSFLIVAIMIVIIVLAPKRPFRPELTWYDRGTVYEILPESFQDSSFKNDYTSKGDGVGDLKGKIYIFLFSILLLFSYWAHFRLKRYIKSIYSMKQCKNILITKR